MLKLCREKLVVALRKIKNGKVPKSKITSIYSTPSALSTRRLKGARVTPQGLPKNDGRTCNVHTSIDLISSKHVDVLQPAQHFAARENVRFMLLWGMRPVCDTTPWPTFQAFGRTQRWRASRPVCPRLLLFSCFPTQSGAAEILGSKHNDEVMSKNIHLHHRLYPQLTTIHHKQHNGPECEHL